MRQSLRPAALLSALALVVAVVAGCSDSGESSSGGKDLETDSMTVAALPIVDTAALYVAQNEGLFKKEGLNVRIKPVQQSTQAIPALVKGDVQAIAGANYVSFLQANDKGTVKLSVLAEGASLTSHMMDLLVMPDSRIKSPKDLEGRKVAVNILNNVQTLTLNAILTANNVDASKVDYVQVPFPQMAAALERGQVDAVHLVEPFTSDTQTKLGARVTVDGGAQPVTNLPISGFVTTQDFTTKKPKTAAAFQRAIFAAQQLASTDREAVEKVLPGYAKIDAKVAAVITLPGFPSTLTTNRMQRVVDLMMAAKALRKAPDMKTILFQAQPAS
ncbi:ABC transporter substrate-binding protein [Spirillospora sp. NBC_00431]